jgi:peptide/nickel transport system permease protein
LNALFEFDGFRLVVLWTDALVFVLLAAVCALAVAVWRSPLQRQSWRGVFESAAGAASAVVLAVFLVIGLLDSLHFRLALPAKPAAAAAASAAVGKAAEKAVGKAADKAADKVPEAPARTAYAVEVLSVLDLLLAPLRERRERTYSAPLATVAFQKETVERPDGSQAREFPRLRFGGAHLKDAQTDRAADIAQRGMFGLALGAAGAALLAVIVVAWVARSRRMGWGETARAIGAGRLPGINWRALLLAAGIVLLVIGPVVALSAQYHVLGTSKVGQSVLYLSLKSIRTSLVIGTLTTLVLLPFAVLLGIAAGYFKGWVDDLIQYVYTTIESIPSVLLIAAGVLLIQVFMETNPDWFETAAQRADFRLLMLCVILALANWTGLCRLLRGEALKLRELDYVQAAHAFGVSHWRVITRHLAPNMLHIVLISAVMGFSGLVLAEAVLSYVGVGVDPSMISFGTMINDARLEMAREPMVWWSLAAAFGFMLALVLAANLFADAVRDAFDPRSNVTRIGFRVGPQRRAAAVGAAR